MKKQVGVAMAALMASAVLLTGCGGGAGEVLKEGDHATLRFMAGGTQWQGTYLANLKSFVDDFNDGKLGEAAKALNVTIDIEPVSDMASTYPPRLRNADRYPHLLLFDRFNTPEYVENDFILDVQDKLDERNIGKALFTDEAIDEMIVDGKAYGTPIDLDMWGIYVNTGMVNEYNSTAAEGDKIILKNDWTWNEFFSIAQKLTKKENNEIKVAGYYTGDLYEHFFKYFLTTGENFLSDNNVPNMDSGAGKAVLEYFNDLNKAGISKKVEDIGFPRGQVAMYTESIYFGDYIERINAGQTSKVSYRFMPMPKAERAGYTFENASSGGMFGGFGLVIPKPISKLQNDVYYSYVDRTMDLIEWWTTGEGAAIWASYNNTMPALKSLQSNEDLMGVSVLKDAVAFVDSYQIRPQLAGFMNYQIYTINSNVKRKHCGRKCGE